MEACEVANGIHLSTIEEMIESRHMQDTIIMEDMERRKRVKRTTNLFALIGILDVLISFPLIIYALREEHFTEISALFACMQISCFLVLSIFSSLFIMCSKNYDDRIDAIGAWALVHLINLFGNVSLVTFEIWPDVLVFIDTSFSLTILICWKLIFILLEVVGSLYCLYITHKPAVYFTRERSSHPLFNEELNGNLTTETAELPQQPLQEDSTDTARNNLASQLRRPVSVIYPKSHASGQSNLGYEGRYGSYLSLTQCGGETRYVRNPCYESELSLDYANNFSPYDSMMLANRNRLSYAERLPRVLPTETHIERNRPYLHNGAMSNRNSYISTSEANTSKKQYGSILDDAIVQPHQPIGRKVSYVGQTSSKL